jgi:uncharacterized protein (DUF3084 family)
MPTILFLAAVVLASGLIAYFADWLGRKLGKKRLTIGKLRPRHTAALGTTISGMLISILTIGFVMIVSSDVREWIIRGDVAIREAKEHLAQLQDLKKELGGVKSELTLTKAQYQTVEAQKKQALAQIPRLEERARSLTADVENLTKERDQAKRALASSERDVQAAKARLANAQRSVTKASADVKNARADVKKANADLKYAIRQYNDVNERTGELERQLDDTERKLSAATKALDAKQHEVQALDLQLEGLQKTLTQTQEDLTKTSEDLEEEEQKLEMAKLQLERAKTDMQRIMVGLQANMLNTRWRRIIVPGGEELARLQIAPGQSEQQVRGMLENVLKESREAATNRGAKAPRAGSPAASLRDQMVDGKLITADEQASAVIRAATNLTEESVIIARSFWNVFEEEDVPLMVVAYRNPLIYRQGQVVAETRVDGSKEDGAILQQLSTFLSEKVKAKALADKMIPAAGREDSLGAVSFEELFSLARDIKESRRQVRIQAIATQDTRAADQLKLDLRIR